MGKATLIGFGMALLLLALAGCGGSIGVLGAGSGARVRNVSPEIKVSHLPKLNEPFTVTGKFTALKKLDDVDLWLEAGRYGVYLDGEAQWHGPLVEGEARTLTATFAFVSEGNKAIGAQAASKLEGLGGTGIWGDDSLPIFLRVTNASGVEGYELSRFGNGTSWKAGDLPIARAGHAHVVDTTLQLNSSDKPRIEFVQSWDDVKRLQDAGLFPAELRYRWRRLFDINFSKQFLVVYFDALQPEPGHTVGFEGFLFQLEDGVLKGDYRTYSVPPEVIRPPRPVSAVEVRAVARRVQPESIHAFAFRGVQTFQFTLDGQPLPPITVDLKTPEESKSP